MRLLCVSPQPWQLEYPLVIFLLVQRFAGGYLPGIIAVAGLLTCIEVFAVGVSNLLDSVFSMFVPLAMGSFFFANRESISGKRICLSEDKKL